MATSLLYSSSCIKLRHLKIILILLFQLLICNFGFSQKNDSTYNNKLLLEEKLLTLENKLKDYEKEKEYFQIALSSQTTIFSLIVGGIVGLFAILTFGGIRIEIKNYKTNLKLKFKETIDTLDEQMSIYKKHLEGLESENKNSVQELRRTYGEICNIIAEINSSYLLSYIKYKLLAANLYYSNEEIEQAITCINDAVIFSKKLNARDIEENQIEISLIDKYLDGLLSTGKKEIILHASEIHSILIKRH